MNINTHISPLVIHTMDTWVLNTTSVDEETKTKASMAMQQQLLDPSLWADDSDLVTTDRATQLYRKPETPLYPDGDNVVERHDAHVIAWVLVTADRDLAGFLDYLADDTEFRAFPYGRPE